MTSRFWAEVGLLCLVLVIGACRASKPSDVSASPPTPDVVPTPQSVVPTSSVAGIGPNATPGYEFVAAVSSPDFTAAGSAGACAGPFDRVTPITLALDTANPRCAFVKGDEHLRISNDFNEVIVLTLGRLRIVAPPRGSVLVDRPFSSYLRPGGYILETNLYDGQTYGAEIRYEPGR